MSDTIEMILIKKIAVDALRDLANNDKAQQSILLSAQTVDDFIQVKMGNVSNRSLEEAIEMALTVSVVRDDQTLQKIISVITTLYATTEINRGAIVGGTLLKEFGSTVFPHIDKKELRFAKPINKKLLNYISGTVKESFTDYKAEYNVKDFADYSNCSMAATSGAAIGAIRAGIGAGIIATATSMILAMITSIFKSKE